jgi:hypothetical protein
LVIAGATQCRSCKGFRAAERLVERYGHLSSRADQACVQKGAVAASGQRGSSSKPIQVKTSYSDREPLVRPIFACVAGFLKRRLRPMQKFIQAVVARPHSARHNVGKRVCGRQDR